MFSPDLQKSLNSAIADTDILTFGTQCQERERLLRPGVFGKYFLSFPQKMYKLRQQFVYFLRGVCLLFNFWTIKSMSNLLISPTTDFIELFEPMEHAISPIFSSKSFCLSEKNKRKIITVNQSSFHYSFSPFIICWVLLIPPIFLWIFWVALQTSSTNTRNPVWLSSFRSRAPIKSGHYFCK